MKKIYDEIDMGLAYCKGREDIKIVEGPSITVREISRLLVNLRKNLLNQHVYGSPEGLREAQLWINNIINETRKQLELRRRSREVINVSKDIRGVRKVHRTPK